jgi:ribosomal protein S1
MAHSSAIWAPRTDGLLHVSQLADGFVENVTNVVQSGSKVKVRVLSVDLEKGNYSLTMKPLGPQAQTAAPRARPRQAVVEVRGAVQAREVAE